MKNIIITIGFVAGLFSCHQTEIVKIDGCEYIKSTSVTSNGILESLTHKGNCTNPMHVSAPIKKDSVHFSLPLIQKPL